MPRTNQKIIAAGLWAIIGVSCALPSPPPKSSLNSPISSAVPAGYVSYAERDTTLVYAPNPSEAGGFGFLALIGGRIVRVNGCLLLEPQQGHYVLPIWSHRISFVNSGPDELVIAANGKTVGTVGSSIRPEFGGGYFTLREEDRKYSDTLTPTCKRVYDSIAWINLR
jgi:hypothetical protein